MKPALRFASSLWMTCYCMVFSNAIIGQSIYYVREGAAPGGDGSTWSTAFADLQNALDQACGNSPAQIWVAAGTYYPTQNTGDSTSGPADRTNTFELCNGVAIYGGFAGDETALSDRDWMANVAILSGDLLRDDSLHNNSFHVVKADSVDQTAILDGLTIAGGNADVQHELDKYQEVGGGICLVKSSPVIRNCIIHGNTARYGAGMFMELESSPSLINVQFISNSIVGQFGRGGGLAIYDASAPTFTDCLFDGNAAAYYGGGIYNVSGKPIAFANCAFNNNTGRRGGGVYSNFESDTKFSGCTFTNNTVTEDGGAIANFTGSRSEISDCTFAGNNADNTGGAILNNVNAHCSIVHSEFTSNTSYNGGAVYNIHSRLRMRHVQIRGNSAANDGAGIHLSNSNSVIANSLISGNAAAEGGGGVYMSDSPCWLINNTFTGNKAPEGGAIYNWSEIDPYIINTIIWNNAAGADTSTVSASIFNRNESTVQVANSIIANSGGSSHWDPATGVDRGDNLDLDPQFVANVDVSTLPSIAGDLHLQMTSPAIDAGTLDTAKLKLPGTDLDDQPRFVHGRIDMGAYEYQGPFSMADCAIAGPAEIISLHEQEYTAIGDWVSYMWSVDGDARIISAVNQSSVTIQAGTVGTFLLTVHVRDIDNAGFTCAFPVRISVDCSIFGVDQRVYVNEAATGNQNGLTWADAFTDLQSALHVYCDNVTEVWVAKGVYEPSTVYFDREATFQLLNGKAIYGGFAGTETELSQRDIMNNLTELSGDIDDNGRVEGNVYNVVTGSGTDSTAILDGFTIARGYAFIPNVWSNSRFESGGGMHNINGSPSIYNCVFLNNWAGSGAGMMNINSSPRIHNSKFIVNYAGGGGIGGGMTNAENSSPVIANTMFWENVASRSGGGMYNIDSSPRIDSCLFSLNELRSSASTGVGMFNSRSAPVIHATDFVDNIGIGSSSGGGMYNNSSSPQLVNCKFDGNEARQGGGMTNDDQSSPELTNCLFLENTTRTNGFGGGMNNQGNSNPVLTDCRFEGNVGDDFGGGINNNESSPLLHGCSFVNNIASQQGGGGMANYLSSATLTACLFSGNEGQTGGGIYNTSSSPRMVQCLFSDNAGLNGGAVSNRNVSSPVFDRCTFTLNSAGFGGGGIENKESSPVIVNCHFSNNTAEFDGGAIYTWDNATPLILSSVFHRNISADLGGALSNGGNADPLIANCTFSGNEAGNAGGAIADYFDSNPTIVNSVIWNNRASGDANVLSASIHNSDSAALAAISYSLIANTGGSIAWNPLAGIDMGNNIDTDPLFYEDVLFASVPDSSGDFHLLEESLAINAGNPDTTGLFLPLTDPDGNPRILQERIDMGAYEIPGIIIGIDPTTVTNSLTIHPNPATDEIHIAGMAGVGDLVLYDMKGVEISRQTIPHDTGSFTMNVGSLRAGVYTIRFLGLGRASQTKMFVKLK